MDFSNWPKAWRVTDADIEVGQKIIHVIESFVLALVNEKASASSINRHLNNLFLMGGEIIREIQTEPELKELDGTALILKFVDDAGGPYCRHVETEAEQKAYDSTCRKLHRFLNLEHR